MRPGRALDVEVYSKIMNQHKIADSSKIPHYSTDIYDAYKVLNKLQTMGWSCHIGSRITANGTLLYRARVEKGLMHCERLEASVPMAICSTAMAIINDQYVEFVTDMNTEQDENLIQMPNLGDVIRLKKVGIENEQITDLVAAALMTSQQTGADLDSLSKEIIDILTENGYFIYKKEPDDQE